MRRWLRIIRRDEAGMTVAEMTVTVFILAIVLAALLGGFDNLTRVSRRGEASVNNQDDVRQAMTGLAREVRGASLLLDLPTLNDYASTIRIRLGDASVGGFRFAQWRFDPATKQLLRQSLAASTSDPTQLASPVVVTGSRIVLTNVRNAEVSPSLPFFRYYDELGNELTASENTVRDFSTCARRIRISVVANPQLGFDAPAFSRTTDVQLRNGGTKC